jgi:DNA-binding MarR family transcriptional regulator
MLHANTRREKVFGAGRPRPMDREAKIRLMTLARALSRKTEARKHYGAITAKALDVLSALLWGFHNAKTGLCFPSIDKIAKAARCSPATVQKALRALEACGLLSWVNRIVRRREHGPTGWRWRVYRTSNGYAFTDPREPPSSNANNRQRTLVQVPSLDKIGRQAPLLPGLEAALERLRENMQATPILRLERSNADREYK